MVKKRLFRYTSIISDTISRAKLLSVEAWIFDDHILKTFLKNYENFPLGVV